MFEIMFNVKYFAMLDTCGWHFRCSPGTDREVIIIVIQRSKNTVPVRANKRRIMMNLQEIHRTTRCYYKYTWEKTLKRSVQELT